MGSKMRLLAMGMVLTLTASPASATGPSRGWAVVGVTLFPSPDAEPMADAVILIRGERVVRTGERRVTSVPPGYRVIDARGASALAGFWNAHVHLTRPAFLRTTAASDAEVQAELEGDFTRWGFTTVFDLASTTAVAQEVKSRLATGRVAGPRVLSVEAPFYPPGATPVYARPFYQAYGLASAEIASPAEGAERARRQLGGGADGVKLFTGSIQGGRGAVTHMEAAAVRAISSAAHRKGKPVFAHPTDSAGLKVAVENGVDVLAHSAPLMGPWSADQARAMVRRRVALIPTLSLFADADNPATPAATAVQQTKTFAEAGGDVLFGTDAGFTNAFDTGTEMRLMAEALGWRGLLASLTTTPAKVFKDAKRGRIAAGATADIVVVDGDPRHSPEALSRVRLVIRDGKVIYRRP